MKPSCSKAELKRCTATKIHWNIITITAIGIITFLQVDVFFGPCCDYAAAPVARQTRYWNVPILTSAAMARDYAVNRLTEFPMLTRVGANFNSLALFLVDVLRHFLWTRVMLVYNPQGHADEVRHACWVAVTLVLGLVLFLCTEMKYFALNLALGVRCLALALALMLEYLHL